MSAHNSVRKFTIFSRYCSLTQYLLELGSTRNASVPYYVGRQRRRRV